MLLVLLIALTPCCGRKGDRAKSPSRNAGDGSKPAVRPEPLGVQIGAGDSLIRSIEPRLVPWVAMWRPALPGFAAESLFRVGQEPAFRRVDTQPLKNLYPPSDEDQAVVFQVLGEDSPDGQHRLVFDWYQYIECDSGEVQTGGDVDSAPLLLDRRRGLSTMFESCGTPCGFDWGAWISPTHFVLGGWEERDAIGRRCLEEVAGPTLS